MANLKDTYGALAKSDFVYMDPETILIAGLDFECDEDHPGLDTDSNETPLNEKLVASIMTHGVKELVTIYKDTEKRVVAADGRSRIRAAREANKRLVKQGSDFLARVPARIDADKPEITMVVCNRFRRDITTLERARKAARLRVLGHTEEEIAASEGVQKQTLKTWKLLLQCTPEIQAAVATGSIPASTAAELGKLPVSEQQARLATFKPEELKGSAGKEAARTGAPRTASQAWTKKQIDMLREECEPGPQDEEDVNLELVHAILGVLTGVDVKAKGLAPFPSVKRAVQKHMKKSVAAAEAT